MTEPGQTPGVPAAASRLRVRTVEILPGEVVLIDQRALPNEERYVTCHTWQDVAARITDMTVRGAPAIGVTAAGGVALAAGAAAAEHPADAAAFRADLDEVAAGLRPRGLRPSTCAGRWPRCVRSGSLRRGRRRPGRPAAGRAQAILADDIARCLRHRRVRRGVVRRRRHDPHALQRRRPRDRRVRHGAGRHARRHDATAGHLGARRRDPALAAGRPPHGVGARRGGHPYRVITDNMAGHFIQRGAVDGVVVGADRIAANGDTANKIGTYTVSVLAKEHGVPFYVAAPLSTVDLTSPSGARHTHRGARPRDEVTTFRGRSVAPAGARAYHPAFDVTPAANIAPSSPRRRVARAVRGGAGAARAPRGSARRERRRRRGRSAAGPQGHGHGGRARYASVPAHRPHRQAHGAHPHSPGHVAHAAPAGAPRRGQVCVNLHHHASASGLLRDGPTSACRLSTASRRGSWVRPAARAVFASCSATTPSSSSAATA